MTKFVAPGTHLLVDFYNTENLQDAALIEKALRDAADACEATVLQVMLHHFGEGSGVTGVSAIGRISYEYSHVAGDWFRSHRYIFVWKM